MADHVREHRSLLASLEKRLLIWIDGRLPPFVQSDHLTVLAMVAMVAAGAGFAVARWDTRALWITVGALAVNWFGDSLDGTLARLRRAERPRYGFYVDHVVDITGITVLMAGLGISGFMTPTVALAVLVAYLLVSAEVFLATAVLGVFRLSFAGIGPTELRIVLAAGALALFRNPDARVEILMDMRLFDVGGVVATAGLLIALFVSAWKNTMVLARLEPPRQGRPHEAGARA
jgi:phosphatidylglycerophosphate synthase